MEITSYDDLIDEFLSKAKHAKCSNGKPKEFMAYLVGYKEDDLLIATELIYPEQEGDGEKVEDISGENYFRYSGSSRYTDSIYLVHFM